MNRRTFLCGLTLGTLSVAFAAGAQQVERVFKSASSRLPPHAGNGTFEWRPSRSRPTKTFGSRMRTHASAPLTGHKTVAVFQRYAIVSEPEQVDVAQRLQARATGCEPPRHVLQAREHNPTR